MQAAAAGGRLPIFTIAPTQAFSGNHVVLKQFYVYFYALRVIEGIFFSWKVKGKISIGKVNLNLKRCFLLESKFIISS